jgi:hypothetical protein
LYCERGDEIEPLGHGRYEVPGCSGGSYTVDLKVFTDEPESCTCPDHRRHPELSCKYLIACCLFRAKTRARMRREAEERRARRGAGRAVMEAAL